MEEKKTLKIKKPYLIIFTIAIVFAIMGFIDLKVNAAELEPYINLTYTTQIDYTVSGKDGYTFYNFDGLQLTGRLSESGFDNFAILRIDQENESGEVYGYKYEIYVVDTYGYSAKLSVGYDTSFSNIPEYAYYKSGIQPTNSSMSWKDIYLSDFETVNNMDLRPSDWKSYPNYNRIDVDTNIPMFSDMTQLENYLLSGDTTGQIIDCSQLEVDDNMPVISDILYNFIRNEKPRENDTTGLGWIKDIEYYDYLTWKNNSNYSIQLEYCPVVQVFNGFVNLTFDKEYYGEWSDYEILESNTVDYTKRVDKEYLNEYEPYLYDYRSEIIDNYTNYGQYTHLFIGYRLRYVDSANLKAGAWTYLVPDKKGNYYSYSQYSDGSTSDNKNSVGTDNTYQNTDVEDAKNDIDKENEVKEEIGFSTDEIDVDEAKTWLDTVSEFIKGTPQFIGATLSFLPKPILYGMYVCIFMSVVAVAVAIFKALI